MMREAALILMFIALSASVLADCAQCAAPMWSPETIIPSFFEQAPVLSILDPYAVPTAAAPPVVPVDGADMLVATTYDAVTPPVVLPIDQSIVADDGVRVPSVGLGINP